MRRALVPVLLALMLSSCGLNMYEQPSARVLETLPYDEGRSSMLPLPEGTVARNVGAVDPSFYSAQRASGLADELPFPVTLEVLERGQERYNIYCAPCHSYTGDGLGLIVQRGMPQPRSFHDPAVASQPVGYYFNAMTNGFGRMFSYASRVPPEDRWAISAYIRALQLSQAAGAAATSTPTDQAEGETP